MREADPAPSGRTADTGGGETALRVISSLILAPLAIFTGYVGGWVLAVFWGVAAILVFWEWTGLVLAGGDRQGVRAVGMAPIAVAIILASVANQASGELHTYLVAAAFAALGIG